MFCDEKYIDLNSGLKLYAQIRNGGYKKWLVALHGLGEHLGRHQYLIDLFSEKYNICQFDLRGHGKSQGKRGHIDDFAGFSHDLNEVISFLKSNFSMESYCLYGHSMGALVCSDFIQNYVSNEDYPEKIFLSCPPVGMPGAAGKITGILPFQATRFLSNLQVGVNLGGTLDIRKLSHIPQVYEDYVKDPLTILKPHTSLLFNIVHTSKKVFSRPLRAKCPLFCATASLDTLVNSKDTVYYFNHVEKTCILKIFKGAYHEVHNEEKKWQEPFFDFVSSSLS